MSRAIPFLALFALAARFPVATGQIPDAVSPLVSYQFLDSLSDTPEQPSVLSPLVSYQFLGSLSDTPEQPSVLSPLVSYQYLDSLSDTPEQPSVFSPLVSYQYCDWPGDENLAYEFSAVASYFFGGGVSLALTGTVNDLAGMPIPGAEVILLRHNTVFWQGLTAADGSITATLPAGNFNVVVIKAGYASLFQSVAGDNGGPVILNLTLRSGPQVPTLTTVTRVPEATAIRPGEDEPIPGTRAANLRVFNGLTFSPSGVIKRDRMTVVITHGMWSNLDSWATEMANSIKAQNMLGDSVPNIVGWDWRNRALGPFADEAAQQGEHLGKALDHELGADYRNRIHFIGHSLGTIVNALACDYLHGRLPRQTSSPWNADFTVPHVTLLDHAELANVFGSNVTTSGVVAWFDAQSRSQLANVVNGTADANSGYKSPFPVSAVWIDNYITTVGLYHRSAVNAYVAGWTATVWGAHSQAHEWYQQSVQDANPMRPMGFSRAFEKALAFPPTGPGLAPGSLWYENLDTAEPNDLRLVANPQPFEAQLKLLAFLSVSAGAQVGSTFAIPGQSILNGYEAGIRWVGDLGGTAIVKTGQVAADVSEKLGNLWDAALDKVSTINPDTLFSGNLSTASLRMLLSTPAQGAATRAPRSSVSPPQAWIPIQIPADAAFLVFDFTVTGNPGEDQIACAINEQNLFTLPARFAPDGSPVSTDFLDVSAYAGQQAELYFGLVGGTSSGCTLAIDGIRFVTIPMPKLAATVMGDQVRLSWPAAAVGWVLQRNPGLAPEGWEDVALPETVSTVDGVVTLDRARSSEMEFFRLRRGE